MYVMSPAHASLGRFALKSCARRLAAMGCLCSESVVRLKRFRGRAFKPFSRISRATRFCPTCVSFAASSA